MYGCPQMLSNAGSSFKWDIKCPNKLCSLGRFLSVEITKKKMINHLQLLSLVWTCLLSVHLLFFISRNKTQLKSAGWSTVIQ